MGHHHHSDDAVTSTIDKSMRGETIQALIPVPGRVQVRFRRITPLPVYKDGSQFSDEIMIRDCYGIASVAASDFGDVTCVQTRIQATSQSTAVKERKMQCVVTRKVLERHLDNTFGPALVPSQEADDIICHMALDPQIGGRTVGELDVDGIYATVQSIRDYFGFAEAAQFNYTFDDDNTSFEEMVQMVAQSVFCNAYRQGSLLKLFFEQPTEDSTLLFNHRNKLPGSETRTVRFGNQDDHDGVEFDWRTTEGEQKTIYIPADRSAVKASKIERAGVTDLRHAFVHANRIWNRMRYQNTTTEFDATAEASQLVLNERIEVTDNTRPDVFDGHIVGQVGLVLQLTQPFTPEDGVDYDIFIQLPGGGLDVIPVVAGDDEFHVVLQTPTSEVLSYDPDNWADVVYQIVGGGTPARPSAFLVSEKGAYDKQSVKIQAINYDPRYYQNDHDLPDGTDFPPECAFVTEVTTGDTMTIDISAPDLEFTWDSTTLNYFQVTLWYGLKDYFGNTYAPYGSISVINFNSDGSDVDDLTPDDVTFTDPCGHTTTVSVVVTRVGASGAQIVITNPSPYFRFADISTNRAPADLSDESYARNGANFQMVQVAVGADEGGMSGAITATISLGSVADAAPSRSVEALSGSGSYIDFAHPKEYQYYSFAAFPEGLPG